MSYCLIIYPLNDRGKLGDSLIRCKEKFVFEGEDYRILGQIGEPNGKPFIPDIKVKPVVSTYKLMPNVFCELHDYVDPPRKTRKNPWGGELVYTFSEEMGKIKLPDNVAPKNRAILAYLRELEPDTPIILEWR